VTALNELATKSFDGHSSYAQVVRFVHVYVIEPHPATPDISPYTGAVWEAEYSTKNQAMTYADRVALAAETAALLEGEQRMLVDDMQPLERDNPVWCSYGPAPNSAYLVRQDGTLHTVQEWLTVEAIEEAIDSLLSE